MISSRSTGVGWSSAVPAHDATALGSCSSCSFLNSWMRVGCSPNGCSAMPSSSSPELPAGDRHPRSRRSRIVSRKDSYSLNFNFRSSCSQTASSSSGLDGLSQQSHQSHHSGRIELKRLSVVPQSREFNSRRDATADDDDPEAGGWSWADSVLGAAQTRRDILTKISSAVALAVANYFLQSGSEVAAEASVSQRVRLKDVDDQKLQDALRAAVVGDLENAETLFTEIIKEEPTSASGWSNRGSVRISLGKYEQATYDFTRAIELAPEAPVPYLNRAISYEAVGRFEEAIADCKAAIENDPEEPAAWYNLGNVEARVKDYDTSLLAYQRASILAPGIAGYRLRQALVLFQVGRVEESKKLLQGLVRKYPNYTEAHAALAALLWSEGRRSNAEEQFFEATNREPLYTKISWVERELQWPPGVLQAFAKFLSTDYSPA